MRAVFRVLLGTALLLSPGLLSAQSHVVHISVDGLGAVYLLPYLTHAPSQFPNFVRLRSEGAATFNARCDYFSSDTIPNHASMLTGRPALQPAGFPNTVHHGYLNNPGPTDTFHNSGNPAVPYKASFFDVAHDHGFKTALYVNKTRLSICDLSYDGVNGAPDLVAPDNGRDKIDIAVVNDGPSITAVVDPLLQDLNSASPAHYSFIHLREPDITGHNLNWGSVTYSNMVRTVDQQIGRILSAITQNPVLFNRTCVILSADHGGGGADGPNQHSDSSHPTNYTIPFFLWGPGIPAGVDLYSLFANRRDPGTNRTDYTLVPQPIRNGDGGNLALTLLQLPPIPGSFMNPVFAGPRLTATCTNSIFKLTWRDPQFRFFLRWTSSLRPPISWKTISTGITEEAGSRVYRETNTIGARFFSLQRF